MCVCVCVCRGGNGGGGGGGVEGEQVGVQHTGSKKGCKVLCMHVQNVTLFTNVCNSCYWKERV